MIDLSTAISHYKREDIQKEIVYNAQGREVAVRFNDHFGQRPDALQYPKDILELAKQGATSFHASEEIWRSPLQLDPMMRKKDMDDLRIGWDLVLDVDCPNWEYSKLIADLIVKALIKHNVKSVSCKFSGNKGFHIGVPFEAFPNTLHEKEIKEYFPDGVRIIAEYLINYIDSKETDFEFTKQILSKKTINEIADEFGKEIIKKACKKCGKEIKEKTAKFMEIGCPYCTGTEQIPEDAVYFQCKKCGKIIKDIAKRKSGKCGCGSAEAIEKLDTAKIINVDALLISSRHLYRMPYSLHEKSGLCSIPIDPSKIKDFDKTLAKPQYVRVSKFRFLDKDNVEKGNAKKLFDDAFHWHITERRAKEEFDEKYNNSIKKYEIPTSALSEAYFPPCMKKGLEGLKDGRKRFLFILVNFLSSVGWAYEDMEKRLKEWNKKNEEPLRETYLVGQIRYHKQQKKKVLPPNCSGNRYYQDLQLCVKDNLCPKIKNPVNYSMRKVRYKGEEKKKKEAKA